MPKKAFVFLLFVFFFFAILAGVFLFLLNRENIPTSQTSTQITTGPNLKPVTFVFTSKLPNLKIDGISDPEQLPRLIQTMEKDPIQEQPFVNSLNQEINGRPANLKELERVEITFYPFTDYEKMGKEDEFYKADIIDIQAGQVPAYRIMAGRMLNKNTLERFIYKLHINLIWH